MPSLLKIVKRSHRDFDICYIGYDTIKKFNNCDGECINRNIRCVIPLYLILYSATGYFEEKNGDKYLILNSNKKYEEILSEIISKIKTINEGKELFYEKDSARIGVNTNGDIPLNKQLKFPTSIIIIRCVFHEDEELNPFFYLDECLYESV